MEEVEKSTNGAMVLDSSGFDNRDFFTSPGGRIIMTPRAGPSRGHGAVAGYPGSKLLEEQNQLLFKQLQEVHQLSDQQMAAIRAIFARSGVLGQGNPAIVEHPMAPEQCRAKLEQGSVHYHNPEFERICAARYMAPLYDPDTEGPRTRGVSIS
jgi:hypothetical protein